MSEYLPELPSIDAEPVTPLEGEPAGPTIMRKSWQDRQAAYDAMVNCDVWGNPSYCKFYGYNFTFCDRSCKEEV